MRVSIFKSLYPEGNDIRHIRDSFFDRTYHSRNVAILVNGNRDAIADSIFDIFTSTRRAIQSK